MKKYLFYILYLSNLLSCASRTDEGINVVEILSDAQYFDMDKRQAMYIGSTLKIAFRGNHKIYILLRKTNHTKDIYDEKTHTLTSTVIKVDTSYIYHVIKNGKKTGLMYGRDRANQFKGEQFHLDTLLKYQGMDDANIKLLNLALGTPLEIIKTNDTKKIEKYLYTKTKKSDPDSIYRYYDTDFKQLDFTFSPSLDKEHNSKLIKTQLVYNPKDEVIENQSIRIPRLEMNWSLRKIEYPKDILNKYFQKFLEDSSMK